MINILGIPLDTNSSFLRGPMHAPDRIRQTLHCGSGNYTTELGLDIQSRQADWQDHGNIDIPNTTVGYAQIADKVSPYLGTDQRLLAIGGDHSVTYPLLQAHAAHYPDLTILHIDAHGDLYDELDGNRHSHACPFARIMEDGLAKRLVQVGIRALTPHQYAQIERFGVECYEMKDWSSATDLQLTGPLYVSLDIDSLDPSVAPGVSHHEPGGLSFRDVLSLLHSLELPIVGADIVEYNPMRDVRDMTAMVSAKFYKEILGLMLMQ